MTNTAKSLQILYNDTDNTLTEEINKMKGRAMFHSFYESYNHIVAYHTQHPTYNSNYDSNEYHKLLIPKIEANMSNISFSGEEVFGKYLDLHECFNQYCNIPNILQNNPNIDYIQYLNKFHTFFYISESIKLTKPYKSYLASLWMYLSEFFLKTQPLVNKPEIIKEWKKDFDEKWKEDKIMGWKGCNKQTNNTPQPLRLGMFNSPEELEALGMDRLKEGLEALGLKCGGTLKDRALRLWSIRGIKAEDIPEKLRVKSSSSLVLGEKRKFDDGNGIEIENKKQSIAWDEFKIISICDILMDIITSTRKHVEKQQTRTKEEREQELYEEEFGTLVEENEDENDDDDEPIYNPLNIPLGWDGKPIPYWLYKLHGLGDEFKCEICGNQSYWGRRNFDKHFQEFKHSNGMRNLGIPNTKHFHDITLIEDALTLYEKIKDQLRTEKFIREVEEEFEDTQGNVLNRQTYEDLARQGLL